MTATDALHELLDSLLFEGYALYPYTPGATKNATPTPFGIVYPPAYATAGTSTFDHLELRCELHAPDEEATTVTVELRCLVAAGKRQLRLAAAPVALIDLFGGPLCEHHAEPGAPPVDVELSARRIDAQRCKLCLRVTNRSGVAAAADRAGALQDSLLSTHPVLRVAGGHFVSPLDSACRSVNTFPVLATADDDVLIGATIMLPDHPQIAPESRGSMFDGTEIEEALLLHVQALSDAEREEIAAQGDGLLTDMLDRAGEAGRDELLALHGRVTLRDPEDRRRPETDAPPQEPANLPDPSAGEAQSVVDGVVYRRGARVRIQPPADADLHARMLAGHTARIERILVDFDGKTHFGLTIEDDPGQQLMSETGRFLFFFANELELIG